MGQKTRIAEVTKALIGFQAGDKVRIIETKHSFPPDGTEGLVGSVAILVKPYDAKPYDVGTLFPTGKRWITNRGFWLDERSIVLVWEKEK